MNESEMQGRRSGTKHLFPAALLLGLDDLPHIIGLFLQECPKDP